MTKDVSIEEAFISQCFIELYSDAISVSRKLNQTVGSKCDYYITLEQLEALIKKVHND